MKMFKIRFLTIIALLTFGLIIAAQAGFFKKAVVAPPPGVCLTIDAINVTVGSATFHRGDNCSAVPGDACIISFTWAPEAFVCPGGNKFCCAILATELNCTEIQTRIAFVMCEPG